MKRCLNCGTEFEGKFCPECGSKTAEEKVCPKCGRELYETARFCSECGYSFEDERGTEEIDSDFANNQHGILEEELIDNSEEGVSATEIAVKTPKIGKFYCILKYVPTVVLALYGLLSLLFFLGSAVILSAFGRTESMGNLYELAFTEESSEIQAASLALFIVSILTITCAATAFLLTFLRGTKHKTVSLGKLILSVAEIVSLAGTTLILTSFIIGCVICGKVNSLNADLGAGSLFGLGCKVGAAPILVVVFGIIFGMISVASVTVKFLLGVKFPELAEAEKAEGSAVKEDGRENGGSVAPKGYPLGLNIINLAIMRRISACFMAVTFIAVVLGITLPYVLVGSVAYLKYVFWGMFGGILLATLLSIVIPVNLKNRKPKKILKPSGKISPFVFAGLTFVFSFLMLAAATLMKRDFGLWLRAQILIGSFGMALTVILILIAVVA